MRDLPFNGGETALLYHEEPVGGQSLPAGQALTPDREAKLMDRIYRRGDRLVARFIALHTLIALGLAGFYQTWLVTGVVSACAVGMFALSASLLPRSFVTRCVAGIVLQIFVALHIYQLHGLGEMHFFFFTSFTMLIVYQDWKCMWPGAVGLIGQHLTFALMHNAGIGAGLYFYEEETVGLVKLAFHFSLAFFQVGICGYWAYLLRKQTLAAAVQNAGLRTLSEKLHESEGEFRALIEHAQDVITVVNRDGTIRYESPATFNVLGYPPGERIGQNMVGFMHPDDQLPMAEAFTSQAAALGPETISFAYRYLHRDNTYRIMQAVGSAVSADGGIVIDSRDVTDQYLAEQEAGRRAKQQQATSELARKALAGQPPTELFQFAVGLVSRTLEVEFAYIAELAADREALRPCAVVGHAQAPDEEIPVNLSSQGGYTLLSGKPVVAEDFATETRFSLSLGAQTAGVRSGLSVPVGNLDKAFGVLVAQSGEPGRFTGDDIAFLSAVADILSSASERHRTEQALRYGEDRYHALVRVSAQILWTASPDGLIREMPEWAAFTGQSDEELQGFGWEEAIHPADREHATAEWIRSVATKNPYVAEYRLRKHDGSYENFTAHAVPLLETDGSVRCWVGANANITAKKQVEEALQAAKNEAERANAAKSEFLSRMSHELRTPLNAILGFGQLLEMGQLPRKHLESVGHITKAGRHLLGLIDEVLAIARIEAGRLSLSLEPVSVPDIVGECVALIGHQAEAAGVACENLCTTAHGCDQYVHADHQRLRQVLLNFLSNAVKYNRPEGRIVVSYRLVPGPVVHPSIGKPGWDQRGGVNVGNWLSLEVADTGGGLTAGDIGRLFTPFERLSAERTAVEGTGLGLALSKALVEAMGGKIGVDSVPGEGSTFWVRLPPAADPHTRFEAPVRALALPAPFSDAKATVLYIEDNLSNLRLIEMLLERRPNCQLLSAQQGILGLEIARASRPDLILLDLHLPDIPGWEVLTRLQAEEVLRDIPVLIISADATPKQIDKLMSMGVCAYITKPIEVDKLMQAIDEHISKLFACPAA